MKYILLFIISFTLILSALFIVILEYTSIDVGVCKSWPNIYINWCIKSYNRLYNEYVGCGIGNRIKGIVELLSLSFSNNYYPQSIYNYKYIISC